MARIPATNQTPACPLPLFCHYFYNKSNIEIVVKNLCVCVCVCAKSLQSCPTPCDPTNCTLPGSSVPGILQASILEWVAISLEHPK